jgi:hypothetical protein
MGLRVTEGGAGERQETGHRAKPVLAPTPPDPADDRGIIAFRRTIGVANATRPDKAAQATHPSGDNRFKMLDASLKRHRFAADALIEVLHTAQELFGFLQPDLLLYIAQGLKLPPSRVYGVATFYHFFSFAPQGRHTCVVCTGTACYVKGADALLDGLERQLATI